MNLAPEALEHTILHSVIPRLIHTAIHRITHRAIPRTIHAAIHAHLIWYTSLCSVYRPCHANVLLLAGQEGHHLRWPKFGAPVKDRYVQSPAALRAWQCAFGSDVGICQARTHEVCKSAKGSRSPEVFASYRLAYPDGHRPGSAPELLSPLCRALFSATD